MYKAYISGRFLDFLDHLFRWRNWLKGFSPAGASADIFFKASSTYLGQGFLTGKKAEADRFSTTWKKDWKDSTEILHQLEGYLINY